MAGEAIITVTGNVGGDAELRVTPSGATVTSFSIANTPRVKKNNEWIDGETIWFRCFVWGKDATGAATITKGVRVTVTGRFSVESYTNKDNELIKSMQINADSYGVVPRNSAEPAVMQHNKPIEDPVDDPWAV